jgi:hypothetical protein
MLTPCLRSMSWAIPYYRRPLSSGNKRETPIVLGPLDHGVPICGPQKTKEDLSLEI